MVSYEVCGFQRNVETCLKERRNLFRKAVIDCPHADQRESRKAQMRKDMLENLGKEVLPLKFGERGAQALEETQLEHVLWNREEANKPKNKTAFPKQPVPEELSVDRYATFASDGNLLFMRQMQELSPEVHVPVAVTKDPSLPSGAVGGQAQFSFSAPDGSPVSTSPRSPLPNNRQPTQSQLTLGTLRFQSAAKKIATFAVLGTSAEKQRERHAEKRRREDLLMKRIVSDRLPPEFCEHSLDTTWVSPIADRLFPVDRDRHALLKRTGEAHQLKMRETVLPSLMPKSRSAPELRAVSRGGSGFLELPRVTRLSSTMGNLSEGETTMEGQNTGLSASFKSGHSSQRTPGLQASSRLWMLRPVTGMQLMEVVPPTSLLNDVVLHRLTAAGETFHANSFGNYVKDYDITSGEKKLRMCPEEQFQAEDTYVTTLQALVGPSDRPALKMYDSPQQSANRRMQAKPCKPKGSGAG